MAWLLYDTKIILHGIKFYSFMIAGWIVKLIFTIMLQTYYVTSITVKLNSVDFLCFNNFDKPSSLITVKFSCHVVCLTVTVVAQFLRSCYHLNDIYCFYVVLHGLNDNKYFSKNAMQVVHLAVILFWRFLQFLLKSPN